MRTTLLRQGYGVPSKLSEADKFELQQYITRCYGSHHVQRPVQKQGRPVPNQRSGQAERLRNTRSCRFKTPGILGSARDSRAGFGELAETKTSQFLSRRNLNEGRPVAPACHVVALAKMEGSAKADLSSRSLNVG
jgi:hypothetical protein